MMQHLLTTATTQLQAVTDVPQLEATLLLLAALNQDRAFLYRHPDYQPTTGEQQTFLSFLARRFGGEPIAYILGEREFWSLPLQVTHATLIPRPETELLVETALTLAMPAVATVADLGTGSGAIACALAKERPAWHITAIDDSADALAVAKNNAARLGFSNISFCLGNWSTVLSESFGEINMIVSNPPYLTDEEWANAARDLRFEPERAFVAGSDGLLAIKAVITLAATHLVPRGWLLIEHGWTQEAALHTLFTQAGFQAVRTLKDLAGLPRVTLGAKMEYNQS